MKLRYPDYSKKPQKERNYVVAQIIWYTILPTIFMYAGIKHHPLLLLLILPTIFLRLEEE